MSEELTIDDLKAMGIPVVERPDPSEPQKCGVMAYDVPEAWKTENDECEAYKKLTSERIGQLTGQLTAQVVPALKLKQYQPKEDEKG